MPNKKLEQKIADYIAPEDRIKQLQAIFYKYKKGLDLEGFREKMHQKFGLKIALHQEKQHQRPYGYTIIDYPQKQVFKGSQILPLKQLPKSIACRDKQEDI